MAIFKQPSWLTMLLQAVAQVKWGSAPRTAGVWAFRLEDHHPG